MAITHREENDMLEESGKIGEVHTNYVSRHTEEGTNEDHNVFHFDLSYVAESTNSTHYDLAFHVGTKKYDINTHTSETILKATKSNKALSLIPKDQYHKISHFSEVPAEDIPKDRICQLRVTASRKGSGVPLPDLLLLAYHIPRETRLKYFRTKLGSSRTKEDSHVESKLIYYGVNLIDSDIHETVWDDEAYLLNPKDTAESILFHHPELGSTNPDIAVIIKHDHINSKRNKHSLDAFATAISSQGRGGWAPSSTTEFEGNVICYDYDIKDGEQIIHKKGDPIYSYKLSDKTLDAAGSALSVALKTSKDDNRLRNKKWSVLTGSCADSYEQKDVPSTMNRMNENTYKGWTITERKPYLLYVYEDSINIKDNIFSVDFRNISSRCLGAYVQFLDDKNHIIVPSDWKDPEYLKNILQPNTQKKYLELISAVNTIMGVPAPVFAETISFPFPKEASSAKLIFGSLGTYNWDNDVIWPGLISTGIFQYGVPTMFLVAGAILENTAIYKQIMDDKEFRNGLFSAAGFVVTAVTTYRAATGDTKNVLSRTFSTLGSFLLKILYKKGLEKLLVWVTAKITTAAVEQSVPFGGWAYAIASRAIDGLMIATTTAEILALPAKIEVEIKREMSLELTLRPDITHGKPGHPETAVWPNAADHYRVTVMYKGGTNFINEGPMYKTTSGQPLKINLPKIPSGGQLQIIAGIFSGSDDLVGRWQSDWIDAFPNSDNMIKLENNITECMVPLTSETEYSHKEKIVYDNEKQEHVWQLGEHPMETRSNLDCSNSGKHLCKPASLTINTKAYQIGYVWRASYLGLPACGRSEIDNDQAFAFQNISVLERPDSDLKFPNCSLGNQPIIAYDQFGLVDGDAHKDSGNNFYLEFRNGTYHLRKINLSDPTHTIDLKATDKKSWGRFSQDHLDSMIVHPDGYAIGVSWMNHKMEILKIPEAPSDDDYAVESQLVSGEGVREGLMCGPIAINAAPDGRLLLLESINKRIQAFDTKGNPVPSFDGKFLFSMDKDIQSDLDKEVFPDKLQEMFQNYRLTYLCDIDLSLQNDLDCKIVSEALRGEFIKKGQNLSFDKDNPGDQKKSSYIDVRMKGREWIITDPILGRIYNAIADKSETIKIY